METIWSIKDCQLQRNEDILNLDIWCKNNHYQSKFSKEWHSLKKVSAARNISIIFAILWNFSKPFAILFKFYNTFWNFFWDFAIHFAIFWKYCNTFCNNFCNTLRFCNTKVLQYYCNTILLEPSLPLPFSHPCSVNTTISLQQHLPVTI